jgi:hypothetical protein
VAALCLFDFTDEFECRFALDPECVGPRIALSLFVLIVGGYRDVGDKCSDDVGDAQAPPELWTRRVQTHGVTREPVGLRHDLPVESAA